jgi:O-antigen/teichoic acid export membrane protein
VLNRAVPKLWAAEAASRILNALAVILAARNVGAEAYGAVGFVSTFVLFGVALIQFGTESVGVRELARRPGPTSVSKAEFRSSLALFRFCISLFVVALFGLTAYSSAPEFRPLYLAAIIAVLGWTFPLEMILVSEKQFHWLAVAKVGFSAVNLAVIAAVVDSPSSSWGILAASGLGMFAMQVVFWGRIRHLFAIPQWREIVHVGTFLFREGLPLAGSLLLLLLYGRVAIFFLQWLRSPAEVGWFVLGMKIHDIAYSFFAPFGQVLLPEMQRPEDKRGEAYLSELLVRGVRSVLPLALFMLGTVALGGDVLINALFGSSFAPAVPCVIVLVGAMVFRSVSLLLTNGLLVLGLQRVQLKISLIVVMGGTIAAVAAVELYGAAGAAWSTALTFGAECLLLSAAMWRQLHLSGLPVLAGKMVAIGTTALLLSAVAVTITKPYIGAEGAAAAAIAAFLVLAYAVMRRLGLFTLAYVSELVPKSLPLES